MDSLLRQRMKTPFKGYTGEFKKKNDKSILQQKDKFKKSECSH